MVIGVLQKHHLDSQRLSEPPSPCYCCCCCCCRRGASSQVLPGITFHLRSRLLPRWQLHTRLGDLALCPLNPRPEHNERRGPEDGPDNELRAYYEVGRGAGSLRHASAPLSYPEHAGACEGEERVGQKVLLLRELLREPQLGSAGRKLCRGCGGLVYSWRGRSHCAA
ncbi:hypothetical protein BX600DRAFT_264276 [Xylariales sp. PMI_506]|nr:hypothetical protein BX600DRAFT_264276 [Xylariales sp. PMI_506]